MEATIRVLVVILSLLLVLGIAAYAFRMIEENLPGNPGSNQGYPNPLNWLKGNSAAIDPSQEAQHLEPREE